MDELGHTMKTANAVGSWEDRAAFLSGAGSVLEILPQPAPDYEGWSGWKSAGTISDAMLRDWGRLVSDYLRMRTRGDFQVRIHAAISSKPRKLATG